MEKNQELSQYYVTSVDICNWNWKNSDSEQYSISERTAIFSELVLIRMDIGKYCSIVGYAEGIWL